MRNNTAEDDGSNYSPSEEEDGEIKRSDDIEMISPPSSRGASNQTKSR